MTRSVARLAAANRVEIDEGGARRARSRHFARVSEALEHPGTDDSGWQLAVKRGANGASAYDQARKHNLSSGSEREWLQSLKVGARTPPTGTAHARGT
jgi:hypothetical protein